MAVLVGSGAGKGELDQTAEDMHHINRTAFARRLLGFSEVHSFVAGLSLPFVSSSENAWLRHTNI